jgi:hypothetical protein
VAETLKIMACHLSCAMQADVAAVSLRHGLSTEELLQWQERQMISRVIIRLSVLAIL